MKANDIDVRGKIVDEWTDEERATMAECYQECFESFVKYYEDAQANGKVAFAKEHANFFFGPTSIAQIVNPDKGPEEPLWMMKYPEGHEIKLTRSALNETIMPDEFLNNISPVFLIRHPALSFSSFERQMRNLPPANVKSIAVERRIAMTHKFTRSLYAYYADLFNKHPSPDGVSWPLVIDADDIIQHQDLLMQVGELMGMDPLKMKFTWQKANQQQVDALPVAMRAMLGTLHSSTGVQTDKLSTTIDIDVEAKKWKEEFGEEAGTEIERLVRDAMPDYEWLKSKRMIPRTQKKA
jgi:hypothetical protein